MPQRLFASETWSVDEWFLELTRDQRYLFIYLWSNDHVNQAGVYRVPLRTMAFETQFTMEELRRLLPSLSPKVEWLPESNYIWVRNFLKHQAKSPKFIQSAINCLNGVPEDLRAEFELYYHRLINQVSQQRSLSLTRRECVLIRDNFCCQYCGKEIICQSDYEMDHIIPVTLGGRDNYLNMVASCRSCNQQKLDRAPQDAGLEEPRPSTFHAAQAIYILKNNPEVYQRWLRVFPEREEVVQLILGNISSILPNIASDTDTDTVTGPDNGRGGGKTAEQKTSETTPPSESESEESLSVGDHEVILVWRSVKGFGMSLSDASELVARLRTEFPDVDILAESKKWAARKLTEPLTKKSRPSAQIWNWMCKAREFAQERRVSEGKGQRARKVHGAEDFRGRSW